MKQRAVHRLNFSEKSRDIEVAIGFLTSAVNHQTIFPVHLKAKNCLHPVKYFIFYVFCESEVILTDSIAVFIFVEDAFGDHQLVPILVVGVHEDGQKSNNNRKKPTRIGEHLINFAHFPLDINVPSVHSQIDECIVISQTFQLDGCFSERVHKIAFVYHYLLHGHEAYVSFYLVRCKLDCGNNASFGCEGQLNICIDGVRDWILGLRVDDLIQEVGQKKHCAFFVCQILNKLSVDSLVLAVGAIGTRTDVNDDVSRI